MTENEGWRLAPLGVVNRMGWKYEAQSFKSMPAVVPLITTDGLVVGEVRNLRISDGWVCGDVGFRSAELEDRLGLLPILGTGMGRVKDGVLCGFTFTEFRCDPDVDSVWEPLPEIPASQRKLNMLELFGG